MYVNKVYTVVKEMKLVCGKDRYFKMQTRRTFPSVLTVARNAYKTHGDKMKVLVYETDMRTGKVIQYYIDEYGKKYGERKFNPQFSLKNDRGFHFKNNVKEVFNEWTEDNPIYVHDANEDTYVNFKRHNHPVFVIEM